MDTTINILAYGSIVFSLFAAYLQINKLWSRKHIASVAESVSIPGRLVESIPLFFFGIYFVSKGDLVGIADNTIWMASAIIGILVGSGFWVKGNRGTGFWRLAIRSVKQERKETTWLFKQIIRTDANGELLDVLKNIAAVDGDIDQREIHLIEQFSEYSNVALFWDDVNLESGAHERIIKAKRSLDRYLAKSPSESQVRYLQDFLQILIDCDDQYSPEKNIAFNEIREVVGQYCNGGESALIHEVLISPDGDEQDEAIRLILKPDSLSSVAGGRAYSVGQYFTHDYAEVVCSEYRALGFFTVTVLTKRLS